MAEEGLWVGSRVVPFGQVFRMGLHGREWTGPACAARQQWTADMRPTRDAWLWIWMDDLRDGAREHGYLCRKLLVRANQTVRPADLDSVWRAVALADVTAAATASLVPT